MNIHTGVTALLIEIILKYQGHQSAAASYIQDVVGSSKAEAQTKVIHKLRRRSFESAQWTNVSAQVQRRKSGFSINRTCEIVEG